MRYCITFFLQKCIPDQVAGRGSADRPHHGGVRAALLRAEPASLRGARHLLHPLLLHHHAQHDAPQPQRQDEALPRRVRQPEQGHQLGQGPTQANAGEIFVSVLRFCFVNQKSTISFLKLGIFNSSFSTFSISLQFLNNC